MSRMEMGRNELVCQFVTLSGKLREQQKDVRHRTHYSVTTQNE